eukprot:359433-Chlamydomonas_euryale.AAC.3
MCSTPVAQRPDMPQLGLPWNDLLRTGLPCFASALHVASPTLEGFALDLICPTNPTCPGKAGPGPGMPHTQPDPALRAASLQQMTCVTHMTCPDLPLRRDPPSHTLLTQSGRISSQPYLTHPIRTDILPAIPYSPNQD